MLEPVTHDGRGAEPDDVMPWRQRDRRRDASFLSPAVRRLATVHGLDPASVTGTGRDGRVTRRDMEEAAIERAPADQSVALGPLRRAIATHLLRATREVAHAHVVVACDYSHVERARQAGGMTYLPFVARAVVDALAAFPRCNATSTDDGVVLHPRVGLGIAVDLDTQGLIVPVVHEADVYRLRWLGQRIADVAARARAHQLDPDDVTGGTFTITNPGPYGTHLSVPIVNHPQVAILATDGVRKQVVAVADEPGALAIRPIGMLSLSYDRRAIDGEYATSFVGRVRDLLEQRDWTLEL